MAGLVGVGLYFLPSIVAVVRQTHNATGIFLLNLLLGWTGVGWIIAFILALCSSPWPPHWQHYYYPPNVYPPNACPPNAYPPRRPW